MSRTISVSTDVFAAIWANRHYGEETEDAILRRVLGCTTVSDEAQPPLPQDPGGVVDSRNGVTFPRGFEIFRIYKNREFKAVAEGGAWVRTDTGERFPTLNQLNHSIAAGNENVWNGNWKYRTEGGAIRSIDLLRH